MKMLQLNCDPKTEINYDGARKRCSEGARAIINGNRGAGRGEFFRSRSCMNAAIKYFTDLQTKQTAKQYR